MQGTEVERRFEAMNAGQKEADYNFEHFRAKHLIYDAQRTIVSEGIQPGEFAPDFELPQVGGGTVRLSDFQRGRPTILHFGSYSWPITAGSVEPLKKLYINWNAEVHFIDVLIRQAHPGPGAETYYNFEQKMRDGERYKQEDDIPHPVLVDDLQGTTHQVYGGLADPTYLIDADGRVAFYNMWTHAPTLHEAIEELMNQGGRGIVKGGTARAPHLLASMTDGWKGLRRGLPQSFIDLETSMPGAASGPWLGYRLRPLLAPLALRGKPLPVPVKVGLAVGAGVLIALGANALRRSGERKSLKNENQSSRKLKDEPPQNYKRQV